MQAQQYQVVETVVYQDNQSAILLELNGKQSSRKRTRHMTVKYFFIKDRVDAGEFTIKYCPTEEIIADFFTNPLQGSQSRKMRTRIMNIDPSIPDYSWSNKRPSIKGHPWTTGVCWGSWVWPNYETDSSRLCMNKVGIPTNICVFARASCEQQVIIAAIKVKYTNHKLFRILV